MTNTIAEPLLRCGRTSLASRTAALMLMSSTWAAGRKAGWWRGESQAGGRGGRACCRCWGGLEPRGRLWRQSRPRQRSSLQGGQLPAWAGAYLVDGLFGRVQDGAGCGVDCGVGHQVVDAPKGLGRREGGGQRGAASPGPPGRARLGGAAGRRCGCAARAAAGGRSAPAASAAPAPAAAGCCPRGRRSPPRPAPAPAARRPPRPRCSSSCAGHTTVRAVALLPAASCGGGLGIPNLEDIMTRAPS